MTRSMTMKQHDGDESIPGRYHYLLPHCIAAEPILPLGCHPVESQFVTVSLR